MFTATMTGGAHLPPPAATHAPGRRLLMTFCSASGDCKMSWTAQKRAASAPAAIAASSARDCTTVTLRQPSAAMCSRATAAISGDSSIPTTPPAEPTFSRSRPQHSPVPHPTSRTSWPGPTGSASTIASR